MSAEDAPELHAQDTLTAGAGLCHRDAVEQMVREGPERVHELIEWGARFSSEPDHPDRLALGREGGHSRRRIIHARDLTGREVERTADAIQSAAPTALAALTDQELATLQDILRRLVVTSEQHR